MTTREEVRNRIKDALKAAEDLRGTEPSRELSIIITKLEEADLWAGARFLPLDTVEAHAGVAEGTGSANS
jgi:hypothetical protein